MSIKKGVLKTPDESFQHSHIFKAFFDLSRRNSIIFVCLFPEVFERIERRRTFLNLIEDDKRFRRQMPAFAHLPISLDKKEANAGLLLIHNK